MSVFSIVNFLVKYHMAYVIEFILKYSGLSLISDRAQKVSTELQSLRIYATIKDLGHDYKQKNINYSAPKQDIRVIYAINNSLPETSNGYATRTHYIASAAYEKNIDIYPVTRVGYPIDIRKLNITALELKNHTIDNITYSHLDKEGFRLRQINTFDYIHNYADMLVEFTMQKKANIIHAASDYHNGLAAIEAAKNLNIPSIYEVRGFWEITKASRYSGFKESKIFEMMRELETQSCQDATSVIALSEVIKDELVQRGINSDKIYVVDNGVDTEAMKPQPKNTTLISELGWENKFVVGFIGSVVDYEGLSLLVDAAKNIAQQNNDAFRYLIVGDGNDLKNLKEQVEHNNVKHLFHFTGRVPFEDVSQYYSILDTACYPRKNWEVCSIVSPKKPFEAMAYGIPIISSSVKANSYFIEHGVNGLVHETEDIKSLINQLLALEKNTNLRKKIGENARNWVVTHRNSKLAGELLKNIYHTTLARYENEH